MSIKKIRSALVQAFESANFSLDTVYENTDGYTPNASTPWCEFYFIPNSPSALTLGDDGKNEFTGLVQVNLNYPLNSGIGDSMDKVEEITNVFKIGSDFTYDGQTVTVTRSGQDRGGQTDDGFYQSIISIQWRALAPR